MTCLGFGFAISSKIWCPTCAGSLSVEPQLLHVCLRSGVLMMSGLAGLGLVLPACPLGLPGKRFSHFLWSPVRVGYMRFEDGVFGFSCNSSLRFRFMFSSLSFAFSVVRVWMISCSFGQSGQVKIVCRSFMGRFGRL